MGLTEGAVSAGRGCGHPHGFFGAIPEGSLLRSGSKSLADLKDKIFKALQAIVTEYLCRCVYPDRDRLFH